MRLILASSSPRRADLLASAGFTFEIVRADVDEAARPGESPRDYVGRLAAEKAAAARVRDPGVWVIGADTTVIVGGQMLGKPDDDADSVRMLKVLAGSAHDVLTGVVVVNRDRQVQRIVSTAVHFLPLTDSEIDWYVATGEPRGKAGAYAIQGGASRFVERVDGSYSNVVGLPVATVYGLLRELDFPFEENVRI